MEVILVFALVLLGVGLLYWLIQQRLNDILERLGKLQQPQATKPQRSPDDVRRDLAAARDQLFVLEARLVRDACEELTPEDVASYEQARKKAKASIEKLKQSGEWTGLPFDFEWPELQARLPRLDELYRKVVEAELARLKGEAGTP